jgi:Nucleotidyl transferase AbiEii toxin, Type IV TA system
MPVSDLHRQVAAVTLAAAAEHGFALGGGNALLAHGVISRPTQDVDLFTDQEHGVQAAADAVETALRGAGFQAERQDQESGLSDMFPDISEGLAEWIVTTPGGEQMLLQLAYFDRGRPPVVMDLGPVLDLEDAAGGKVCALASRVEPRDYADVAAALGRYSPAELIGFARRLDPGLAGEDFAYAGLELDRMDDRAFAELGLSHHEVIALRERFAAWPRDARTTSYEAEPGDPAQHKPGHEQSPAADRPEPGTDDPLPDRPRQHQPADEPAAQAEWEDPEAEP